MKKVILRSALSLSLGLASVSGMLLISPAAHSYDGDREGKRGDFQERRLERLTEELNLTADQQTKLRAIFESQGKKMRALHQEIRAKKEAAKDENALEALRDQYKPKKKALRDETNRKVLAALNADQKTRYEAFKQEMKEKRGHHKDREKSDRS